MATTEHGTVTRLRPSGTRVQSLGLILAGGMVLVVSAIVLITDPAAGGEILGFFGPVAVGLLVAAWLVSRFGTWARIVGILVSLVAGFLLFWTAFGLMAPDSFVDFAAGLGIPGGILLGLGGGIAALVAKRRGNVHAEVAPGERRLTKIVVGVVVVALTVSGVLTLLGRTSVDPAVAAGATPVDMADFAFVPEVVEVGGSDPRLVVSNSDAFLHDLAVPALDAIVRVTPGSSALLDLAGAAPGTYMVYCTLHSNTSIDDPEEAGMAGTLVIR